MTPPRVLLSAYHCAPGGGSVSQIGWEWYSRLSSETAVTLITHIRNREALEAAGAPLCDSNIVYLDTEWFARPLYRLASALFPRSEHAVFLLSSADFYLFDAVAVSRLKKKKRDFDIVHAVTPVSPLAVTRLHKLGLPLIVGPWNGGMDTLKGFSRIMRSDSEWVYKMRFLRGALDTMTGCTRRASRVLSASAATDRCLPRTLSCERMIENGVNLDLFHPNETTCRSVTGPLEVLFVGRLIPAKGLPMLIEAISRITPEVPIRLTIVGSGSMREELEEQVKRQRLTDSVVFRGPEPQAQIALLMRNCHLFCLPSIRESGGAVLLEAMASGVPALTVAHGGPGELVDDDVGRSLAPDSPESLIRGLADSLSDAFHHPQAWIARGQNGRRRAEQFYGWPGRIEKVVDLYRRVIKEKDEPSRSKESRHHRAGFPSQEHSD